VKERLFKYTWIILILFITFFIIGILLIFSFVRRSQLGPKVKKEVIIEYGNVVTIQDFFNEVAPFAEVDVDLSLLNQVGEYKVKVTIDGETFSSNVKIQDTTSPKVTVKDLSIYIDEELPEAIDFIEKIEELSDYTVSYNKKIEKTIGEQKIEIIVSDKYGNKTIETSNFIIMEDKDAPVFEGLEPITIELGETIDLESGVQAFDQRFGIVSFEVDDSSVDYDNPGSYIISYFAEDQLGNKAIEKRTIEIKEKDITYMIESFPVIHQYPNYPNGCESAALYTLLRYYNVSVTMEQIVNTLKKGEGVHFENGILYGGNPEVEFVGDPRDIHGYGVFQKPIIEVANQFKSGMIDYTGHSLDEVLSLVSQNKPVQVWGSIHMRDTKVCVSWKYKGTDENIDWICDLHSVVIVGYNSKSVFVSDSYTGNIEEYSRQQFEKMYNLFGKRAIYYEN